MVLHIKWDTGYMNINCEAFFPTSQVKLKKLLKIIDLDGEHKEDILNQMMQFLKDLETDAEQHKEEIKKRFQVEYDKSSDLKLWTESGKYSNGVSIKKDEMKRLKTDLHFQKIDVDNMEKDFKRYSKIAQNAKINYEKVLAWFKVGSW